MCIRFLACLYNIDIMARLILLLCVLHSWRHSTCEQGQLLFSNNYLFAIGNDENGYERLLAASQPTNTLSLSLDGYSVSSACGSHPSRCRELLIESTDTSSLTSMHILLVPLEDGVQILELAYNGAAINQISLVTQHTLLFDSVNGNHSCGPSLGVHKIGPDYFIPCIGTDHRYYVCELILNSTAVTQSTLQPCHQVNVNVSITENGAGFSSISNIVATNESLVFLVQNTLYELFPSSSSNSPITFAFPTYCSSVDQLLLLISPPDEQNLLVYCRNRNVITYNLNLHSITRIEEASNIPYPCSPTAQYTVHLSQMQMEFSYKISKDDNPVIRIFQSTTTSLNFHSGTCFESAGGDHLLVYTDRSVGAYLFNMTSESLWLIPATQGCSESDCELPLVYGNRYIVVRNELRRNVMVFDVLLNRSIIDLGSAPLQLVTLMSDLPTIPIHSVPPTIMYVDPTDSSGEPNQTHIGTKRGVSLEVIVPVAILSILVVIIVIAIIILFVIVIKRCCSGSRTSGKYKLPDVTFAKQPQDIVIENYSVPESQPINTVAAELGAEADNDSSYSNPVYSGSHEEMPATVIVFENQATSDSLSVDHNVDTPYPQDPEEQIATDLSTSETQKLIEPDKAGSKDNNLNTTASLEDEINPPSDDQGEVIVNVHASSSGPECIKGTSQPESSPVPSTDQHITESEEPPSQLNSQLSAVRVEEQTVINGTSDPSELISPTVDKEFENGGHVSDGTIDREGEGDRRAESAEHTETSGSLNPPLNDNQEKQDTSIASGLSLSADQKSEDRGCVSDDTKDRESELERSANSTEYGETEEPPLPSNAICTQLNSNGEGEFEEGDHVSDDTNKIGREGDKSDKSALPDEATSELPVTLKGREEQTSGELLSSPDQDNVDTNSDIEGEENVNGTGDKEGEGNNGEISLQVINHSSGLPSEMDSSALESGNPTKVAHSLSHDIDQQQQHTPSDSANPFDHEKQEVGEEDTLPLNSDPDVIHPMDVPVSPILPAVVVPEMEVTEDHTKDLSSVHSDAAEESSVPPEEISEVDENFSQISKDDFERIPKKFEHAMAQELGDNLETRETKGDKGDHGDCKASTNELKHVVDQEDVRENEELNEDKEDDSKYQYETPVPAKELDTITDQDVVGDHLETSDISGNKGDDEFGSEAPAMKSEHQIETKEVNSDERHNNVEASTKLNVYSLEDREEIAIGDHLETKKLNGDKSEDSSDDGNAFNHQSPESFSDVDHDDIDAENHTNPLDLGDETTDLIQLDSVAKLEESKKTNGQSEDEVLLSTECLESDLNLTSLSLRHKEECNGNTELDKPADPEKSLFSRDDSHEEKGVMQDSSTEADQVEIFSGDRMSEDAEAETYDGISIESQERHYEEIAPIKCTFVGRTIKTVVRTSTEANNQYDNYTGNLPKTQHTDTAVSTNRSKESLTLPNGDLAKKAESGHLRNGAFPISNGDANQYLQKNTQASVGDDVLPKQEQKFPYKYETII